MDNDSDKEEFVDLIYSLEKLRANPHIPAEALRALEEAHEIFLHHVREEPQVALQAYAYGLSIGAYFAPQEVLTETDRLLQKLHQSRAGTASAEKRRDKPWRKHAKELAKTICQRRSKNASVCRSNNPSLKLARKAANGFGLFLHQARVG